MDPTLTEEIRTEVQKFVEENNINSALIFQHCSNFHRFHVHQLIASPEFESRLKSFSVGAGLSRRLVLTWAENVTQDDETPASQTIPETSNEVKEGQFKSSKARPDRQLYVPRAQRSQKQTEFRAPNSLHVNITGVDAYTAKHIALRTPGKTIVVKESSVEFPPVSNSFGDPPWGAVTSEKSILEIYDFSSDLKTADLERSLLRHKNKFVIKWVDDTHALAVFVTPAMASDALKVNYNAIKLRSLQEATDGSKQRAKSCLRDEPAIPRPETTTRVAKRMIIGALGSVQKNKGQ